MSAGRPHDLLRLPTTHQLPAVAPPWACAALTTTPWVVVRRARAPIGRLAVGVRGSTRSERYATEVMRADICEVVSPEHLTHAAVGRDLPAMRALTAVRPLFDDTGLPWGPTGSVGFELATGVPAVTIESDLDVLIRLGSSSALEVLVTAHHQLSSLPTRVDCQVETSFGAVALAELVGPQSEILVRTAEGPRLVSRADASS